ncbi:MAG: GAF and ANTAR domain-containing protein [Arthrobacter sp.]|nr:GAF and ANTAR domain-containing protein [Arthrobacter sp.]
MTSKGPLGILAATDGPAGILEELQFTLGEGPCIDASVSRRPVLQPELGRTGYSRWPGFTAGALEAGVKAVFAFPLQVGGIRIGVLDLYRDAEGDLGNGELVEALAFADAAVSVLLHLQAEAGPDNIHPALLSGVMSRSEVHQATGMLSAQHGVSLAQALLMLQGRAYSSDRPILDIARDVLARRLKLGNEVAGD